MVHGRDGGLALTAPATCPSPTPEMAALAQLDKRRTQTKAVDPEYLLSRIPLAGLFFF